MSVAIENNLNTKSNTILAAFVGCLIAGQMYLSPLYSKSISLFYKRTSKEVTDFWMDFFLIFTGSGLGFMAIYFFLAWLKNPFSGPGRNKNDVTFCLRNNFFAYLMASIGFIMSLTGYGIIGKDTKTLLNANPNIFNISSIHLNATLHWNYFKDLNYGLIASGGGICYWACYSIFIIESQDIFNYFLWFILTPSYMLTCAYVSIDQLDRYDSFVYHYYNFTSYTLYLGIALVLLVVWNLYQTTFTNSKKVSSRSPQEDDPKSIKRTSNVPLIPDPTQVAKIAATNFTTTYGIMFTFFIFLVNVGTTMIFNGVMFNFAPLFLDSNFLTQNAYATIALVEFYHAFLAGLVIGTLCSGLFVYAHKKWYHGEDYENRMVLYAVYTLFMFVTPAGLWGMFQFVRVDLSNKTIDDALTYEFCSYFVGHFIATNMVNVRATCFLSLNKGNTKEDTVTKEAFLTLIELSATMIMPGVFRHFNTDEDGALEYGMIYLPLMYVSIGTAILYVISIMFDDNFMKLTEAKNGITNQTTSFKEMFRKGG